MLARHPHPGLSSLCVTERPTSPITMTDGMRGSTPGGPLLSPNPSPSGQLVYYPKSNSSKFPSEKWQHHPIIVMISQSVVAGTLNSLEIYQNTGRIALVLP